MSLRTLRLEVSSSVDSPILYYLTVDSPDAVRAVTHPRTRDSEAFDAGGVPPGALWSAQTWNAQHRIHMSRPERSSIFSSVESSARTATGSMVVASGVVAAGGSKFIMDLVGR